MKPKCLAMALSLILAGCATTEGYKPVENVVKLKVSFTDPAWGGGPIPPGQQCSRFGGRGATPATLVSNIPEGTTDIIVEFNDRDYPPLSYDGGHGKIRVPVAGQKELRIPSVPGETNQLPDGVFKEASHRGSTSPGTAYLPPCSGGRGNTYFAEVKAVAKSSSPSQPSKLLGIGSITLGSY